MESVGVPHDDSSHQIARVLIAVCTTQSEHKNDVLEDAILALGALINTCGAKFNRYLPAYYPILCQALMVPEQTRLFIAAVNTIGDLCRSLKGEFSQISAEIMGLLYTALQNQAADCMIKPAILATFGDVAFATEADFVKYLGGVMGLLHQAQSIVEDPVLQRDDYIPELQQSIIITYTCILRGMREVHNGLSHILPHVNSMCGIIMSIVAPNACSSESLLRACCGLIG